MSIAEKLQEQLQTIADNELKVFAAGEKSEFHRFWDLSQNYGKRNAYIYGFCGSTWTDETYNPKYPIIVEGYGSQMFTYSAITSTKVPIIIDSANTTYAFNSCSKLTTIPSIKFTEKAKMATCFSGSSKIANITVTEDSVIANPINFSGCPLTTESMKSVIRALKDFSGTTSEFKNTVQFSSNCWAALDAEGETSPIGTTWREYVESLGWNT